MKKNGDSKIWCGFGKWAIGHNEANEVVITLAVEPVYGEVTLYDASPKDLNNLAEMFIALSKKKQKNNYE